MVDNNNAHCCCVCVGVGIRELGWVDKLIIFANPANNPKQFLLQTSNNFNLMTKAW